MLDAEAAFSLVTLEKSMQKKRDERNSKMNFGVLNSVRKDYFIRFVS